MLFYRFWDVFLKVLGVKVGVGLDPAEKRSRKREINFMLGKMEIKDTLKDRRLSVSTNDDETKSDVKAQETAQVSVAVSKPAENPEESDS